MKIVIGVDEVGFGAIAGPFVVAAVAFQEGVSKPVLKRTKRKDTPVKDSKAINKKILPLFDSLIRRTNEQHAIITRSAWEVDRDGAKYIRETTMAAAVIRLLGRLSFRYAEDYEYRVIVDGDLDLGDVPFRYKAQAKADETVWQVSCASILAKTRQIQCMHEMHQRHPVYAWDCNNGYGTPTHLAALKEHGVTRYHRRTYRTVKELL